MTSFDLSVFFFVFSQVFWIGDLNYRINGLDIDIVKTMIDNMKYRDLLSYDQVRVQSVSGQSSIRVKPEVK